MNINSEIIERIFIRSEKVKNEMACLRIKYNTSIVSLIKNKHCKDADRYSRLEKRVERLSNYVSYLILEK